MLQVHTEDLTALFRPPPRKNPTKGGVLKMEKRDWKTTLSIWIVCGVVGLIFFLVIATIYF